jgi:hypothetical protein
MYENLSFPQGDQSRDGAVNEPQQAKAEVIAVRELVNRCFDESCLLTEMM